MPEPFKFDTLNTSYVSVAALIRYLREQEFRGRLHVALDQYEVDVFLYGSESPSVWENDHAVGRESQGEPAMQRLLVRSREPGGVITIYEEDPAAEVLTESANQHFTVTEAVLNTPVTPSESVEIPGRSVETSNELELLTPISTEIIAAVERAVESTGMSFSEQFHLARIEIGDDYPFIDPTVGGFEYENSKVNLQTNTTPSTYVQGISESLKRVVNRVAQKGDESSFRERVAVELVMTARRLPSGLDQFSSQLDRIAGTRVL